MTDLKAEYDSYSPITGNLCVLEEADDATGLVSYMCMETGWTTAEHMKIGSETVEAFEKGISELMKDCKVEDEERGLVWYPAFLQMPNAMLYCAGETAETLRWEVAELVDIDGEERLKYPIPGRVNEYYTSRLDIENALTFDKTEFETALDELYKIVERGYDEYQLRDNSAQ